MISLAALLTTLRNSTAKRSSILDYPISRVVDGWVLGNGNLYLFVRRDDGVTQAVTIKLQPNWQRKHGDEDE